MKYGLIIIFLLGILFLGYVPEQQETPLIISGYAISFAAYLLLIVRKDLHWKGMLVLAFVARLLVLFSFPNLSDDIYRFIWDGRLLHLGESPFAFIPSEFVTRATDQTLLEVYPYLNSKEYFSVYPPISQLLFYISTFSWMNTSFVLKLLLLFAEVGTVYFGLKLLDHLGKEKGNVIWYALNPLVIVEITGNIHFEGFMVCAFIACIYFLEKKRVIFGGGLMSIAIAVKLIPLLFMPWFLFQWKWKPTWLFYVITGCCLALLFVPVVYQISGFSDSLDLYFRSFEFNASIYYLLRALGNLWKGYNMIATIGPFLAFLTFGSIIAISFKVKSFFHFCQWALFIFLIFSTTVHPWYIVLGVMLSVFTQNKVFVLWSFLAVLSYAKYGLDDIYYYGFITLEYFILFTFILWNVKPLASKYQSDLFDHFRRVQS